MKHLCLLLSICGPITAFSAPFKARSSVQVPPVISKSSNLHLRIPRGGDDSYEEIIDLDAPPPALLPVIAEEIEPAPASPPLAVASACTTMGFLAPLAAVFQAAGSSYSTSLGAYPILTKSLTAGLTFFLSDYTAQRMEKPTEKVDDKATKKRAAKPWKHDWTRTLVSCAVGLFYFGPAAHAWYEWIFAVLPGTSLVSTLQKAALGQVLFGPSFTCIFFATSLMQSGSFTVGNWIQKIKKDLPGAFISGAGFWPLVDIISFSLVPVKFIPLFINFCSFVWTIYLSMIANRPSAKKV